MRKQKKVKKMGANDYGYAQAPLRKKKGKKWTQAQDDADDRKHGIKEGSAADRKLDRSRGLMDKKRKAKRQQVIAHKRKRSDLVKKVIKGARYNGRKS